MKQMTYSSILDWCLLPNQFSVQYIKKKNSGGKRQKEFQWLLNYFLIDYQFVC